MDNPYQSPEAKETGRSQSLTLTWVLPSTVIFVALCYGVMIVLQRVAPAYANSITFFALILGLLPGAVVASWIRVLGIMGRPETFFQRDETVEARMMKALPEYDRQWMSKINLQSAGSYTSALMEIAAWKLEHGQSYLVTRRQGRKQFFECWSLLSDPTGRLISSNNPSRNSYPRSDGVYWETLDTSTFQELYSQHKRSLDFLQSTHGCVLATTDESFDEVLFQGVKATAQYVKSQRLWPLRMPYWICVRKRKLWNKTIEEQVRLGMA